MGLPSLFLFLFLVSENSSLFKPPPFLFALFFFLFLLLLLIFFLLPLTNHPSHLPHPHRYMDKRVMVKLNGGRVVEGTLRGFDPFMNLVVDEGVEVRKASERVRIGVCVSIGVHVCVTMYIWPECLCKYSLVCFVYHILHLVLFILGGDREGI